MPLSITFLGHSGFVLDSGEEGGRVAVDPFLSDNPKATIKAKELKCDYVAVTHGHADHFADAIDIVKRNEGTLIAPFEVCNYATQHGLKSDQVDPGNPGGWVRTRFGWVAFTQAFHSSSYSSTYMGQPCGLVLHFARDPEAVTGPDDAADTPAAVTGGEGSGATSRDGVTFHHLGDTALFSDLKLIGELYRPDIAAIPCGDRFTMGPKHAARAAEMIGAPYAIPIHWGTWPEMLVTDISGFAPRGVEVKRMEPGEVWEFAGNI